MARKVWAGNDLESDYGGFRYGGRYLETATNRNNGLRRESK